MPVGGQALLPDQVLVGADQPHLCVEAPLQHGLEQIGGGGLSVGPGDRQQGQFPRAGWPNQLAEAMARAARVSSVTNQGPSPSGGAGRAPPPLPVPGPAGCTGVHRSCTPEAPQRGSRGSCLGCRSRFLNIPRPGHAARPAPRRPTAHSASCPHPVSHVVGPFLQARAAGRAVGKAYLNGGTPVDRGACGGGLFIGHHVRAVLGGSGGPHVETRISQLLPGLARR